MYNYNNAPQLNQQYYARLRQCTPPSALETCR